MRDKLRALRQERGWKQKDVVQKLHNKGVTITEPYYCMIENGHRTPNIRIMKGIADIFKTTIEALFFDDQLNETLEDQTA